MSLENERILISTIEEIDKASFCKTSLDFFKGIPETMKSVLKFSGSSDNEKALAAQVYGKLLAKFSFFSKEIKNKQIIPNEKELNACEEVVDNFYNVDEELLRDVPEIAAAMRINEVQPVLSDLKTAIQQKRQEKQNPNELPRSDNDKSYLGIIAFIVIVGIVAIGIL